MADARTEVSSIPRLLVHSEGQTEETFVKLILRPHLVDHGYERVDARLLGNARLRDHRGGIRSWSTVRRDILNHLKQDSGSLNTTMVDYFAMPVQGPAAWPGRAAAAHLPFKERARHVEAALLADIHSAVDTHISTRFVPFVMMHEFEALLFSDSAILAASIGPPEMATKFESIRVQFATPEEINDSPTGAPSKRISALAPEYQKVVHGILAAQDIGIRRMRAECPHFGNWLDRLEAVAMSPGSPQ